MPASDQEAIPLEGRRVAVTGAGGFIGSTVVSQLVARGAEVIGLEIAPEMAARVIESGAEFRQADVADETATAKALADAELIVHTAAYVREWGSMRDFIRVNVGGTANVMKAAEAAGAERVAHISSVVVYGYDTEREKDESAERRLVGVPYIDTKSASDALAVRHGACVLRPGDVYGPGSTPWTRRPAELLLARRFAIPGAGDGVMLPVYIDDLADSIIATLTRGERGRAYTAWDGSRTTFGQYFDSLATAIGADEPRRLPRRLLFAAGAAGEAIAKLRGVPPEFGRHGITFIDRRGRASNQRARDELGWSPRIELPEGIRRSAEWLRSVGIGAVSGG